MKIGFSGEKLCVVKNAYFDGNRKFYVHATITTTTTTDEKIGKPIFEAL